MSEESVQKQLALQNRQNTLVLRYGSLATTMRDTVVELMNVTKDLANIECLLEQEQKESEVDEPDKSIDNS